MRMSTTGAVGIEMAAELKMVAPDVQVTLAHSRDKLLSAEPLPDDVKNRALELVREAGVETLMGHRLLSSLPLKPEGGDAGYEVEFTNGHKMTASVVIEAISRSVPSTDYLPPAALAADGSGLVSVRPTMQIALTEAELPNADRHFAIGDLIHWSGIKRCGAAMHEGRFAGLNIHQLMLQELSSLSEKKHTPEFQELAEIPPMIGLAVGKMGLSYGPDVGMNSGEDVLKLFFGDDLGFRSKSPFPFIALSYSFLPVFMVSCLASANSVKSRMGLPSSWEGPRQGLEHIRVLEGIFPNLFFCRAYGKQNGYGSLWR